MGSTPIWEHNSSHICMTHFTDDSCHICGMSHVWHVWHIPHNFWESILIDFHVTHDSCATWLWIRNDSHKLCEGHVWHGYELEMDVTNCVTCVTHMTRLVTYVTHDTICAISFFLNSWIAWHGYESILNVTNCVTCVIHVIYESCVTWVMCDMSHGWHESWVTWVTSHRMSHVWHVSRVWHESFHSQVTHICVTWRWFRNLTHCVMCDACRKTWIWNVIGNVTHMAMK